MTAARVLLVLRSVAALKASENPGKVEFPHRFDILVPRTSREQQSAGTALLCFCFGFHFLVGFFPEFFVLI